MMQAVRFARIDTVTVPDKFMSVLYVSDNGEEVDLGSVRTQLAEDKESLDYLGIASDSDPLAFPDIYRIIKDVRPRGLKVLIITDGRDPRVMDDLIGAGYAHAADMIIGRSITAEQSECMDLLRDNGCRFAVTVDASEHDEDSLKAVADACGGCSMFILKQNKDKPLKKSEMSSLSKVAKKCTWNVRIG